MNSTRARFLLASILVLGLGLGWYLGRSATSPDEQANRVADAEPTRPVRDIPPRPHKTSQRPVLGPDLDLVARELGAIPGQRSISFSDRDALDRFLASLEGTGIRVLGRIDALNTLRIGFSDADALADLLDGSEERDYIYPVNVPGEGSVQEGAVGFGRDLLGWLGVEGDSSTWGAGVRIAVLDTGVAEHSVFGDRLRSQNLVALPADLSELNGHGTATASLAAGADGLAPGASILSFRVADESGASDTFLLAEAILAAVDSGAHLINISMGSRSSSSVLQRAVDYAQSAGALIVASPGNEGLPSVSYPANYNGVVSVGAVDATGAHLDFSNAGRVTIAAPGLEIASAWPGERSVFFSGTSASAPIVTGAIASIMSTQKLNANQAYERLLANSNEAGAPGPDPYFGTGILNFGRAMNAGVAGRNDIAIASNHISQGDHGPQLQVVVENRGTTSVVNAPVSVTTPSGTVSLNVSTLPAGRTQTFTLPLNTSNLPAGAPIRIDSRVSLPGGAADLNPSNNRRIDDHTPAAD